MKTIPPLKDEPAMWERVEKALREHIRRHVYLPVARALGMDAKGVREFQNAHDDLFMAISKGEIQYTNGHFEGRMRAVISRELKAMGARFNARQGWWVIHPSKLTDDIRVAIATSASRFKEMSRKVDKVLADLAPESIAKELALDKFFDQAIWTMDRQFQVNVSKIGIVPVLTHDIQEHINRQYRDNTKLDIQEWIQSDILSLRKLIQKNTFQDGLRREAVISDIATKYSQSARKARFLARQETSLLMAAFQEKRYLDAGLPRYIWKCVHGTPAHPVRPDHLALGLAAEKGEIQSWSSPPVVDHKTGRRGHPKQDYNCRCTAIALIEE